MAHHYMEGYDDEEDLLRENARRRESVLENYVDDGEGDTVGDSLTGAWRRSQVDEEQWKLLGEIRLREQGKTLDRVVAYFNVHAKKHPIYVESGLRFEPGTYRLELQEDDGEKRLVLYRV